LVEAQAASSERSERIDTGSGLDATTQRCRCGTSQHCTGIQASGPLAILLWITLLDSESIDATHSTESI
jgi:hypothetical protein